LGGEITHYRAGHLYPFFFVERGLILPVVFWLLRTVRVGRGFLTGLFFWDKEREIGGMQAIDALSVGEGRFLDV